MNTKLFFLPFLLIILIGSCQKDDTINFTLYLNSDVRYDAIDSCKIFKISIDGKEKYTDELCFDGTLIYNFPIEYGKHIIKAEVVGQSNFFENTIDFIKSKKFGYLDYRSETGMFDFFLGSSGGID
jgi:hypothetical protein